MSCAIRLVAGRAVCRDCGLEVAATSRLTTCPREREAYGLCSLPGQGFEPFPEIPLSQPAVGRAPSRADPVPGASPLCAAPAGPCPPAAPHGLARPVLSSDGSPE
ncbi:hypothetical protein A6302_02465 [Methylobrevis pamukkalensis]|uniref:Uncharacterized protein n=1 Tax=Methylobrevis pamukkalensis TaxID=1439726 RepID=A0A1E3H3S6_9HYPH|nr:hypothetical protein A6302_02465 [Methylobrevis pamukkalensis]